MSVLAWMIGILWVLVVALCFAVVAGGTILNNSLGLLRNRIEALDVLVQINQRLGRLEKATLTLSARGERGSTHLNG